MDILNVSHTGIVSIDDTAKEIPEVKAYLADNKEKQLLDRELLYLWHSVNSKSAYENYGNKREEMVVRDFMKDPKWQPSSTLKALKVKYEELLDSPAKRLLKASRKAIEEITSLLNTPSELGDDKRTEMKSKMMEKIPKIIEALDKAEERVKKEITSEEKIRGGGNTSKRER